MIHKLEHIGVMVKDVDVSIRFYTEIIGMKLLDRVTAADGADLCFLSFPGSDDVQIELIGRGHDGLSAEGIVHHIAFTVSDIEAEVERLKGLNVEMVDQTPRTIPILNNAKIAFFNGPDGEILELFQPVAKQ